MVARRRFVRSTCTENIGASRLGWQLFVIVETVQVRNQLFKYIGPLAISLIFRGFTVSIPFYRSYAGDHLSPRSILFFFFFTIQPFHPFPPFKTDLVSFASILFEAEINLGKQFGTFHNDRSNPSRSLFFKGPQNHRLFNATSLHS